MKNKLKKSIEVKFVQKLFPFRYFILFVLVVFLGGVLGLTGWSSHQNVREKKSMNLFSLAHDENDFLSITQNYPGTSASSLSEIHLAHEKITKLDFNTAIEIYEKFLLKDSDRIFAPFIQMNLGECFISTKKFDQARKIFETILRDPKLEFLHTQAQLNLGRILALQGHFSGALALCQKLKENDESNIWKDTLEAFIAYHNRNIQK
ncbi:MAG: tetratricopeptide repeat protein [Chlamydiae bacterium]|nr:tetratricopeptide repeat protein [Chlamydiota bacterium]MBI3276812.1 tetratricopeptide repeat protein [Chlamydiota bacterium]